MDCRRGGVIVLGERLLHEGLGSVKAQATATCQVCGARVPVGLDFCPVCTEIDVELTDSSAGLRFERYQVLAREDGTPLELGHGAMG